MSFLTNGIYNVASSIITSIFIIIESVFPYFVAFVTHSIENPHHLIILALVTFIIYYSSVPYEKTLDVREIRYIRKKTRKSCQKMSYEENLESRDLGELPPIYPNGWIPLMESKNLAVGQSVPITALGHQFVIFRGKTGKSFVLDAYCPHLGANLGVCGKVYDDCIQCPFHGWIFSGHDGSCVKIPYTDKVPDFAKTKTWLSIEQNGFIYVWYHADCEQPSWIPPIISEIEQGLWSYKGIIQGTINCHIQEISENLSDSAHSNYLHQATILDFHNFHPDNWWNIFKHKYSSFSWTVDPLPTQHIVTAKFKQHLSFLGFYLSWTQITVEVKQIGPAIFQLYINTMFGRIFQIMCLIPEGPLRTKVVIHFYSPNRFQIVGSIVPLLAKNMIERDICVWNYKKYLKAPILVSEDKTIAKFRKWYSQFYSKNSSQLNKKTLSW